jgi:hypothetical protein
MALELEDPAQGQAQQLADAAAQAQALEARPEPTAADTIQQSAAAAGIVAPDQIPAAAATPTVEPVAQPVSERIVIPRLGPSGALQAPAMLRQPLRTPFEREQEEGMLWKVLAMQGGSALTQAISSSLSGVD